MIDHDNAQDSNHSILLIVLQVYGPRDMLMLPSLLQTAGSGKEDLMSLRILVKNLQPYVPFVESQKNTPIIFGC